MRSEAYLLTHWLHRRILTKMPVLGLVSLGLQLSQKRSLASFLQLQVIRARMPMLHAPCVLTLLMHVMKLSNGRTVGMWPTPVVLSIICGLRGLPGLVSFGQAWLGSSG